MRTLTLLLSAIAAGLAIACGYLVHRLHEERNDARLQSASVQELQNQVRELQNALANDAQAAESISSTGTAANPANVPARATQAEESRSDEELMRERQNLGAAWARMRKSPEGQELLRDGARDMVRAQYRGVARALDLTAEQERDLIDVLAQQRLARERQRPGKDVEEREREQLRTLLGADKYPQYEAFVQTIPERRQVVELRSRLDGAQALSDAQASGLIGIMSEERRGYLRELQEQSWFGGLADPASAYPVVVTLSTTDPVESVRAAEDKVARSQNFAQRIRDRAAPLLTPAQFEALNAILNEQMRQERFRLELLRQQSALPQSAPK